MYVNSDFEKECFATLKNYRDTISGLTSGNLSFCVDCGEVFKNSESCKCSNDPEHNVDGLSEWLTHNLLDVEYICDSEKKYIGCNILIACGGPDVTIKTKYKEIVLIWGNVRLSLPLSGKATEEIDSLFVEYFNF